MIINKGTTLLVLLRQDDVSSSRRKRQYDAKMFLEEYCKKLRTKFTARTVAQVQETFFILGRASMTLFLTCRNLSDIPAVLTEAGQICREMIEERNLRIGMFEPYCFPAVEIKFAKRVEPNLDRTIPVLVFIRTPQSVEELIQGIRSRKDIMECMRQSYIGLGMYQMILWLTFRNLQELSNVYGLLRASIGRFWETSTIIGVPRDSDCQQKERIHATSTPEILFSTSAKCVGGKDEAVARRMLSLSRKRQFKHLFRNFVSPYEIVNLRQGYLDVEMRFMSNNISDAFDLSSAVRKLEGVIDTCTLTGLPCPR
jgi:hypothetical protein